jgi:hypothetical protein
MRANSALQETGLSFKRAIVLVYTWEGCDRTVSVTDSTAVRSEIASIQIWQKGDKFDYYRSIPEFRECILIDQYKVYVEQFVKTPENKWLLSEYESADDVLALSSLPFQVQLGEIYEGIKFETNAGS